MKRLEDENKAAFQWLNEGVGPEHWCKAFFSFEPKCDIVINNHSEVFNSFISDARNKPILFLMENIRNLMMNRVRKNKEKMAAHPGPLCPTIQEKTDPLVKESTSFICKWTRGRTLGHWTYNSIHSQFDGRDMRMHKVAAHWYPLYACHFCNFETW